MPKKVKQVKDKEGVIFTILLDPKISKKKRNRPSTQYVKSLIENKLKDKIAVLSGSYFGKIN